MPRSTLAVRADEKPWTIAEERAVRAALEEDLVRLRDELQLSARDLQDLLRDGVDSAGNDQADIGSTSLERDAELSLAANQRELLLQTEQALHRLDRGTYGICEICGQLIRKARLQHLPFAHTCMECQSEMESKRDSRG
jgi:DnaK suppressor protein